MLRRIVFLWLFLFVEHQIIAQDNNLACNLCCDDTNIDPVGSMFGHMHSSGSSMFAYRYMNMQMGSVMSGDKDLASEDVFLTYPMLSESMRMQMHMLMFMHGLSNRFTLMVMSNYLVNSMKMTMPSMNLEHNHEDMHSGHPIIMSNAGLSDPRLYLTTKLFEKKVRILGSIGVNLPIANLKNVDSKDNFIPFNMRMSSGTFDLLPTISILYKRKKQLLVCQFISEFRPYYNHLNYKLGNSMQSNLWYALTIWKGLSVSTRISAFAKERIKITKNYSSNIYLEPGANPFNSGGVNLSFNMGCRYNFTKTALQDLSIGLEYGLSLYQYLYGIQMKDKNLLTIQCSYGF